MKDNEILRVIKERHSTRGKFDTKCTITKESLNAILEAARWAPTPHNMQNFEIIVIDNASILEKIGKIEYMISEDFVRENYQQLSFSEEELLKKKVGLLGTSFPPELRNPDIYMDKTSIERLVMNIGRFFQSNQTFLVIIYDPDKRAPASEGDFLGIMGLGCVMENMWLIAQSMGIAFHVISALNTDPVEQEVKSLLKIPQNMKIAVGVRLGYTASTQDTRLRVRREIEDFVYYNQYK